MFNANVCVHVKNFTLYVLLLQTQQFCIYIVVLRTRLDCISPKSSLSWVRTHITHTYTYIHTRIRSKREKGKGSEWLHPGEEEESRLNKWEGEEEREGRRWCQRQSLNPGFGSDRSVPYTRTTPNIFILFYSFLLRPHFVMEGREGESRKGKGMTPVVLLPLLPWGTLLTWARFLNSAGDWGRAPLFPFVFWLWGAKKWGSVCFASKLKGDFPMAGIMH